MRKVLVIKSSIRAEGNSSRLVDKLVNMWSSNYPRDSINHRDLISAPIPHLSEEIFMAMPFPVENRTPEQQALMGLSDELTEEFLAADTLIIGMPMYNYGVPSMFKSYLDHIARLGLTFRYTAEGPVGLAGDKKVIFVLTRGGFYWNTENDTQVPYLKAIFKFMGITNIEFVVAEGLNIGPEFLEAGMKAAESDMEKLFVAT